MEAGFFDTMPAFFNYLNWTELSYKQEPMSNVRLNGFFYNGGLISKFQPVGSSKRVFTAQWGGFNGVRG